VRTAPGSLPNVSIVGENDTCSSQETALDCPKTIPIGLLSDVEVVWNTVAACVTDNTVTCPAGKIALSGGHFADSGAWIFVSAPTGPGIPDNSTPGSGSAPAGSEWRVVGANGTSNSNLTAYAIRAKVN
jgi:hypothetical protein